MKYMPREVGIRRNPLLAPISEASAKGQKPRVGPFLERAVSHAAWKRTASFTGASVSLLLLFCLCLPARMQAKRADLLSHR
jgi:hypothetical protein